MAQAQQSVAELLRQGQALHQQGQWHAAAASYRAVLERQPRSFEALHLLGLLQLQSGHADEAVTLLERAAKLKPADAPTQTLLGVALQSTGNAEDSLEHFERAAKLEPRNPEYHYNHGKALRQSGQLDAACNAYETAISLKPDHADALNNLSEVLTSIERPGDALLAADRALALKPGHAEALSNRGAALLALHRHDEAMAALNQALALSPSLKRALVNRGTLHMYGNRFEQARADYHAVLAMAPDEALARWNLSTCDLTVGRFREGWTNFDARWPAVLHGLHPQFDQPLWNGERDCGTVLLWGEQGLGDQIMFLSMLEDAAAAATLRVAPAPRLLPLLARSFPGLELCTPESANADRRFDRYLCMGDLGRLFRPDAESFLNRRNAYLKADPDLRAKLRAQIAGPGERICGLSWFSSNKGFSKAKSVALADLSAALSCLPMRWLDLQYGDTAGERQDVRTAGGFNVEREPTIDTFNDVDGLAALIDACDVIVTISNTTAHLAGALGKPVLLMLPHAVGRFWCWQAERSDTLWYPNVRVFRQPVEGDWASVLSEVRAALMDFAKLKS